MRRHLQSYLFALAFGTLLAATPSLAQPPSQGCWTDCGGVSFGSPGFVTASASTDVFVQYSEALFARFDLVGGCDLSWQVRPIATPPFLAWSGTGVDPDGNLLAAERTYALIHKWSRNGDSLLVWGGFGSGPGKFSMMFGLACDRFGNVFVGDYNLARVQRFTTSGAYLGEWNVFGSVVALAADDSGYVYVGLGTRINKYTSTGTLITTWGSQGTGTGQFLSAGIMACDHLGNIFVNDTQRDVIQVFTTSGVYQYQWDAPGAGGLACDAQNNLYVGFSSPDSRVCKYGPGPVPARSTSWGRVKTFYR